MKIPDKRQNKSDSMKDFVEGHHEQYNKNIKKRSIFFGIIFLLLLSTIGVGVYYFYYGF